MQYNFKVVGSSYTIFPSFPLLMNSVHPFLSFFRLYCLALLLKTLSRWLGCSRVWDLHSQFSISASEVLEGCIKGESTLTAGPLVPRAPLSPLSPVCPISPGKPISPRWPGGPFSPYERGRWRHQWEGLVYIIYTWEQQDKSECNVKIKSEPRQRRRGVMKSW